MKKTIGFISCWDGPWNDVVRGNLDKCIQRADKLDGVLLPLTVCLPARKTLLASLVRSGYVPNDVRECVEGVSNRFAVRKYRNVYRLPFTGNDRMMDTRSIIEKKKGSLISIEIEYYPTGPVPPKNLLTSVDDDGSLRCGGCEIHKITWISKNGRLEGLRRMKIAGKVDKTCGLHVHIDVRHLHSEEDGDNGNGLLSAEKTYDRLVGFYPFLKKLCPRSRMRNKFCAWVNNRPESDDFACPSNGDRYAAINWCAKQKYGSFEFRCQGNFNPKHGREPGTLNVVAYESWALLCRQLVDWASNPSKNIPRKWNEFVFGLTEPIRSWAIMRKESLHGAMGDVVLDERTTTALQ